MCDKPTTYVCHPISGFLYKSSALWFDPSVAVLTRQGEFVHVPYYSPEYKELLASGNMPSQYGEWVRFH